MPSHPETEYTSVAPSLYRAALGPINTEHYLTAFQRLDATGRVLPGWNTAAALCPLGWLAFRRLWREALIYLGALGVGALILFAVGYRWLELPAPLMAGLALFWVMLTSAVPGLYGDALMHAQVRRRITHAVTAAPTMREAMGMLDRQASSRRWLLTVAVVGMVLVALAVGLGLLLGRQTGAVHPAPVDPTTMESRLAEHAGGARMNALPASSDSASAVAAEAPSAPAEPGWEAPAAPASSPAFAAMETGDSPEPASASASTPPSAPAPVAAPTSAPEAPAPLPAVSRKTAAIEKHAAPQPPAGQTAASRKRAATSESAHTSTPPAAQRMLYINVGLFADKDNAKRAQARLRQAGLPVTVQPVKRSDGRHLQRVRVGPFASAAQANAAVAKVRALGLDAVPAAE